MGIFEQWFLIVMYAFMGLGAFALTEKIEAETPMHFVAVFLLWPILLLIVSIMFLFTGARVNDE